MLDYWEADLGRTLMSVAPPDWVRLDLRATMVDNVQDERATAVLPDDSTVALDWPAAAVVSLNELRNAQWEPDTGTWVALRILIDRPDAYVAHYNFELSPGWDPPVTAEDYLEDQNPFPRKPEHVPTWWDGRAPAYGDRDWTLTRIRAQLAFDLPASAASVRVTATAGQSPTAQVRTVNGTDQPWTPPPFVDELLRHHHDLGEPWQSATLDYELRGPLNAEFTP